MTTTTKDRASVEYQQKLSTVVSFLETVFKPDEQLPVLAYVLMNALRQQCLAKTELQNATVGTIRTKLLKLGALITVSSRRILIAITSSCPYKHIFAAAYRCLRFLTNTA